MVNGGRQDRGRQTRTTSYAGLCDSQPVQQLGCINVQLPKGQISMAREAGIRAESMLVFGDGSVRFVKNSISPPTWIALGSISRRRGDQLGFVLSDGIHRGWHQRTVAPAIRGRVIGRGSLPVLLLMPGAGVAAGEPGHDRRGDRVERRDELGRAAADGLARHAENDAGRLVLRDRERSGLAHLEQSAGAVVSHPGHDHAGSVRAGRLGRRAKQDLDAGPVAADRGPFDQLDPIAVPVRRIEAVDVSRDDEGAAGPDRLVLTCLGDLDLDPRVVVRAAWRTRS